MQGNIRYDLIRFQAMTICSDTSEHFLSYSGMRVQKEYRSYLLFPKGSSCKAIASRGLEFRLTLCLLIPTRQATILRLIATRACHDNKQSHDRTGSAPFLKARLQSRRFEGLHWPQSAKYARFPRLGVDETTSGPVFLIGKA